MKKIPLPPLYQPIPGWKTPDGKAHHWQIFSEAEETHEEQLAIRFPPMDWWGPAQKYFTTKGRTELAA